jgi:hypothetical protein
LLTAREKVVTIADLRQLTVLSPESADVMSTLFVRNSPKVDRTSLLLTSLQSSLGMQIVRLIRTSKNPARRVFDDVAAASRYLVEVLPPAEQQALQRFLDEVPASTATGT